MNDDVTKYEQNLVNLSSAELRTVTRSELRGEEVRQAARNILARREAAIADGSFIVTTTPSVEGRKITAYKGVVFGEVVAGVGWIKDYGAAIRDTFGGRSEGYEGELIAARESAIEEMSQRAAARGANAVVGVKVDYETVGQYGSMLMVIASGTAVVVE